jgi:hypothetical protein
MLFSFSLCHLHLDYRKKNSTTEKTGKDMEGSGRGLMQMLCQNVSKD